MGENLVEALLRANDESRQYIEELEETARIMGFEGADADPGLRIGKAAHRSLIDATDRAIASGDVLQMLRAASLHGLGEDGWVSTQ